MKKIFTKDFYTKKVVLILTISVLVISGITACFYFLSTATDYCKLTVNPHPSLGWYSPMIADCSEIKGCKSFEDAVRAEMETANFIHEMAAKQMATEKDDFTKRALSSIVGGKTIVVEFKHKRYITPKMVIQKMQEYGVNSEQFDTYLKTNNISARIEMI